MNCPTGIISSLVTCFDAGGALDLKGFAENLQFQRKAGVRSVCVLGGTGEAAALTAEERRSIMQETMRQCEGLRVVFGALVGRTEDIVADLRTAKQLGASACLVMAPPFVRPSEDDVKRLIAAYASVEIPLILFNTPSRSAFRMSAELVFRLSQHAQVVGIKESSGDMSLFQDIRVACPPPFKLLTGGDNLYLPSMALGGDGGILASAAVIPEVCVALDAAIAAEKFKTAKTLHYALKLLDDVLYRASHPVPLKIAMAHRGLPAGGARSPFDTIESEHSSRIAAVLKEIKEETAGLVEFEGEYPL